MWRSTLPFMFCFVSVARYGDTLCTDTDPFQCKNGNCTRMWYVCDGYDDCGDRSDEVNCDAYENHLQCADGKMRYFFMYRCDGNVRCDDASDEIHCWNRPCERRTAKLRCFHGGCTQAVDECCATREGICVTPQPRVSTLVTRTTLVYADGRSLYSMNFTDKISRLLHRQDEHDITALTHSIEENRVFWVAGESIWTTELTAQEGEGRPYGQVGAFSPVLNMAYDWITANLYLAIKDSRLIICHQLTETRYMLCSRPIAVAVKQIDWLALHPSAGALFMGSFTHPGIEITVADGHGGNPKVVYTNSSGARSDVQLSAAATAILILRTVGEGSLSAVSALDGTEKQITRNITEAQTAPLALLNDTAILRVGSELHALLFWGNRSIVTRKKLFIPSTSRLFTLIDADAQPKAENRCKNGSCDQLCLLVPYGAVCECFAGYKLMDDGHTCVSRKLGTKKNDEIVTAERTLLIEAAAGFLCILIIAGLCLRLLFDRSRHCGTRAAAMEPRASVNLSAETPRITIEWQL